MKIVYPFLCALILVGASQSNSIAQQSSNNDYWNSPVRDSHGVMTKKKVVVDMSALSQARKPKITRPRLPNHPSLANTKAATPLGQIAEQPKRNIAKVERSTAAKSKSNNNQKVNSSRPTQKKKTAHNTAGSAKKSTKKTVADRYHWQPDKSPKGPVTVVISLADQQAHIYRNGVRIGKSVVSTGKRGYETPTGEFTILQKKKRHVSNIYHAKMPYMQRLTWSGIALHGGRVPNYPASHGCIRFPTKFAKLLYGVTNFDSTKVLVTANSHPDVEQLTSL